MLPATMQSAVEREMPRPRTAVGSDAPKIFDLMTRVFGGRALQYTIYHARESVRHIERAIGGDDTTHRFAVMEQDANVIAFYEALVKGDDYFLSYIATDPSVAGHGLGSLLLHDYEMVGRAVGCRRFGLDVFLSNVRAVDWYQRLGFQTECITNLSRVPLHAVRTTEACDLELKQEDLERAFTEENQWGFSKATGTCGGGTVSIGFIARNSCKLLSFDGINLDQAAASIAVRFLGAREVLIIPSSQPLGADWEISSSEAVLRMAKPLD